MIWVLLDISCVPSRLLNSSGSNCRSWIGCWFWKLLWRFPVCSVQMPRFLPHSRFLKQYCIGGGLMILMSLLFMFLFFFTGLLLIFLFLETWQHVRCTGTSCCSCLSSFDLFVVDTSAVVVLFAWNVEGGHVRCSSNSCCYFCSSSYFDLFCCL